MGWCITLSDSDLVPHRWQRLHVCPHNSELGDEQHLRTCENATHDHQENPHSKWSRRRARSHFSTLTGKELRLLMPFKDSTLTHISCNITIQIVSKGSTGTGRRCFRISSEFREMEALPGDSSIVYPEVQSPGWSTLTPRSPFHYEYSHSQHYFGRIHLGRWDTFEKRTCLNNLSKLICRSWSVILNWNSCLRKQDNCHLDCHRRTQCPGLWKLLSRCRAPYASCWHLLGDVRKRWEPFWKVSW